jgi:GNAT superfamily N-acetyltransferase
LQIFAGKKTDGAIPGKMTEIKCIPSTETYAVRHPVLRPGKPLETCRFKGDDDATTVHFGLSEGDRLCGVASVFACDNPMFALQPQLQLRGMAVLDACQGKGYGSRLIRVSEKYASELHASILWCNARIAAVPFYEKCGYRKTGEAFAIGDIGLHYVMFKTSEDFAR